MQLCSDVPSMPKTPQAPHCSQGDSPSPLLTIQVSHAPSRSPPVSFPPHTLHSGHMEGLQSTSLSHFFALLCSLPFAYLFPFCPVDFFFPSQVSEVSPNTALNLEAWITGLITCCSGPGKAQDLPGIQTSHR